jgi:hypothetical protein
VKIEEAVDWTLKSRGPVNRHQLTTLIYSNPYITYRFSGRNEIESQVQNLIYSGFNNDSKYRYCCETNTWNLANYDSEESISSEVFEQIHSNRETYGNGRETVYAIYSPIQRFNSIQLDITSSFPMKIGKTIRESDIRLTELQTGNALQLHVGFEFRTDDSSSLEKYFHHALSSKSMGACNSSKEWFFTNFEEVLTIYKNLKL